MLDELIMEEFLEMFDATQDGESSAVESLDVVNDSSGEY